MKYANWDQVCRRLDPMEVYDDLTIRESVVWSSWCKRRGPAEAARRQETRRVKATTVAYWSHSQADLDRYPKSLRSSEVRQGRHRTNRWIMFEGRDPDLLREHVEAVHNELRSMGDWYCALPERARAKLPRMTFDEAKRASDAWHRREASRHGNIAAHTSSVWAAMDFNVTRMEVYEDALLAMAGGVTGFARVALSPAIGEGDHHAVPGYPEHYWCRLETEDAYRQESARMSNCVGWESTGYRSRYIGKPWPVGIWSLRKGDESLVTAEIQATLTKQEGMLATILRASKSKVEIEATRVAVVQALAAHNHPVPPKLCFGLQK